MRKRPSRQMGWRWSRACAWSTERAANVTGERVRRKLTHRTGRLPETSRHRSDFKLGVAQFRMTLDFFIFPKTNSCAEALAPGSRRRLFRYVERIQGRVQGDDAERDGQGRRQKAARVPHGRVPRPHEEGARRDPRQGRERLCWVGSLGRSRAGSSICPGGRVPATRPPRCSRMCVLGWVWSGPAVSRHPAILSATSRAGRPRRAQVLQRLDALRAGRRAACILRRRFWR